MKPFRCAAEISDGMYCGGEVSLREPDGDTYSIIYNEPKLIPKGCLIPKCADCGETWFSAEDSERVVKAITDIYYNGKSI